MATPVIGLDNACREAWFRQAAQHSAASSAVRRDLPLNVTDCKAQLYDHGNTAFSSFAFNNAGTLLAAGTFAGIIRFIGLSTLSCYCSINTVAGTDGTQLQRESTAYEHREICVNENGRLGGPHEVESQSFQVASQLSQPPHATDKSQSPQPCHMAATTSPAAEDIPTYSGPVRIDHLHFFNADQKLSCISSDYLILYDLTNECVKEITRVNLKYLFDSLPFLANIECPFFSTKERFNSSSQVCSSTSGTIEATTQLPCGTSVEEKPGKRFANSGGRRGAHHYKATVSFPQPVATFCQILRLMYAKDKTEQLHRIDFVIAFSTNPSTVPLRLLWDVTENVVISVHPLLSQDQVSEKSTSLSKEGLYPLVLFTRKYLHWKFLVDDNSALRSNEDHLLKAPECSSETLRESIQEHNRRCYLDRNALGMDFSSWVPDHLSNAPTKVFCAIGVARGVVVLELLPDFHSQFNQICGSVEFPPNLGPSTGLTINRSGTLLVNRSNDRLALITLEEEVCNEDHSDQLMLEGGQQRDSGEKGSSCLDCLKRRVSRFTLQIQFSYVDAVQRERFDCATFCDAPTCDEMFIVCSGGTAPSVHYFGTTGRSGVQSLALKIDMTKTGGLKQIMWRPGGPMWGGLSAKEGCIVLFSSRPTTNIWAVMVPNFEYLEKNREIVETEEEFDDLVWLRNQQVMGISKNKELTSPISRTSHADAVWFTTVVRDITPIPYPFVCPQLSVRNAAEGMDSEQQPLISPKPMITSADLYTTLINLRLERIQSKSDGIENHYQQGVSQFDDSACHVFEWFPKDQLIRQRFLNMLNQ